MDFNKDFFNKISELSFEDIAANPTKYGAPTFQDFKNNREKYVRSKNHIFNLIERGNQELGNRIKKYKFEVFGHRTNKLEEAEKIIYEHGFCPSQMDLIPELIPLNSYDADYLIKFVPR